MTDIAWPSSIVASSTKDVTADLHSFLNGLEPGSVVRFPVYESFRVDGTLELLGINRVELRFQGARLVRTVPSADRGAAHLKLNHVHNTVLRHPWIVSTKPASHGYDETLEAQHAIWLASCGNIEILDPRVDGVWGDKIYIGKAQPGDAWCDGIHVHDGGNGGESGRDNLVVVGGQNILVENVNFGWTGHTGIDIEPNSKGGGCTNLTVSGCTFTHHARYWLACVANGGTVTDVSLLNNTVTGGNITATVGGSGVRERFRFDGNSGDVVYGGNHNAIMYFAGVKGLSVTNNTQPMQQNHQMHMARWDTTTTDVTYSGNTPDS